MLSGMQARFFFLPLIAAAALAGPPAPPQGWTDGYVLANGIRIHYWRTGGARPVLIMLHGSSDDGLCWTNLARELTASFDIIMPDARGHGLTDPPKAGDPADSQVEDLAGLIRELKIDKPIVMGHSMGSSTATWFASKYPSVPRAVVLEDPGLAAHRPGAPSPVPGTPEERDKRRAATLARNNLTWEALVEDCMKSSPKWGRNECEIWAPSKRRHHPDTSLPTVGARPAVREIFPLITVPVLILKADAQGDLRQENEEVAALLPKGKIVHIPGAAHNVRRDEKQKTLETLKPFLSGL
jgi:pimeloyl-ACP methyl ester carboxylesterase